MKLRILILLLSSAFAAGWWVGAPIKRREQAAETTKRVVDVLVEQVALVFEAISGSLQQGAQDGE